MSTVAELILPETFVESGNSPPAVSRQQRRLEATAHHKAAHAVVMHALGEEFLHALIRPDGMTYAEFLEVVAA